VTITAATVRGLYRDCAACGSPVHRQHVRCKICSGPNPWTEGLTADQQAEDAEPMGRDLITVPTLPAPAFEPHVCLVAFKTRLGDVLAEFSKGQVLRDFQTINALKCGGAPIVPQS
jgi:hypothetical protein